MKTLDRALLCALGLSPTSAEIVMDEIESLRNESKNLRAALNAMLDLDESFKRSKSQHVEELAAEGSEIAAAVLLARRALHIS